MTLEQQLFALLEQHDLTAVSLHVSRREDGTMHVYANAHSQRLCCMSDYSDEATAAGAIGSAIGALNVKRTPPTVAVEVLEPMALAA